MVYHTYTGADVLTQKNEDIDLVLTDVVMPGFSWPKLFNRITKFRPNIKVLYMSEYTDNVIVHHGILERGINFIQKPFTIQHLSRKIREILDSKGK